MMHVITDYGAAGDSLTNCTAAIQKALDLCGRQGGGTVVIPPGIYLTGTIYLRSHTRLEIRKGAVLKATPDRTCYNRADFTPQNSASVREKTDGTHLIAAVNVEDVTISGGGVIDGNREVFFDPEKHTRNTFPGLRPAQMLYFCESADITLQDIQLRNAAYWSCFFHGCRRITVSGVRIRTGRKDWNGDGLDIDCCTNVVVSGCDIDTADDCIAIRANGKKLQGTPAETVQVTVSDCILRSDQAAVRFGVGSGTIRECSLRNLIIPDCTLGITIHGHYSHSQDTGLTIRDILISDVSIRSRLIPFCIMEHYALMPQEDGNGADIDNITLRNIRAYAEGTALIQGDRDRKVRNILLQDIDLTIGGGHQIVKNADENDHRRIGDGWRFYQPCAFAVLYAENVICRNMLLHWADGRSNLWEAPFYSENSVCCDFERLSCDPLRKNG